MAYIHVLKSGGTEGVESGKGSSPQWQIFHFSVKIAHFGDFLCTVVKVNGYLLHNYKLLTQITNKIMTNSLKKSYVPLFSC